MIDFTKQRLGTKTRGTRKIELCPKCGRKGECVRREIVEGLPFRDYTHLAENVGGMLFVKDHCIVDAR